MSALQTGTPRYHLIPLEVGGNPTDPKNLWPQPRQGTWPASKKDELENYLHREVCAGRRQLAEAQQAISSNWIATYQRFL